MNDMQESAIATCLAQDYPLFSVYVLDDSSSDAEQLRVDELNNQFPGRLQVLRRPIRTGFKAGNLNYALRQIMGRFAYICVVDSDELLPDSFLRETVAIAEANGQFGFVQAAHRQYSKAAPSEHMDLHWSYFFPARNHFGFVYSYGHGVLFRAEAIKEAGGFPEVVSEDITLSARLRELGYRGYYAQNVECLEEAPRSYNSFRKRNRKILRGTLEFIRDSFPPFVRCSRVSMFEKIDLALALSVIYLSLPYCVVLVATYGLWPLIDMLDRTNGEPLGIMAIRVFYGWDSASFLMFVSFAPLVYLIPEGMRRPRAVLTHVLEAGTVHLAVLVETVSVTLASLTGRGTVAFEVTGDRVQTGSLDKQRWLEIGLGLVLVILGVLAGSLSLVALGSALALMAVLLNGALRGNARTIAMAAPMIVAIAGVLGIPALLVGTTGLLAGIALAHY